ncbi:hybrid sensor histidine kinase/response regulator transcription factor [Saccharicrinis sp. GN24d3]|uniref:hybrid sensor histidine kinase/response regulator transcription factor n=1 Tax=Saccharicrinis sp. GN24d3 TaxID=3458416 RepID=UPI00403671CF
MKFRKVLFDRLVNCISVKLFYFWGLLFLIAANGVYANIASSFQFKHYNYENGLLSNTVNTIIQDKDGFMWFGTPEGLCRFDGYGFKNFTHIPGDSHSLNDNFISSIAEDTIRNCIWVVNSSGVSRLDKTSYKYRNYPVSDSSIVHFSPFYHGVVCVDHLGNVWVEGFSEVYSEGLFKYIEDEDRFINFSEINSDTPKGLTFIYEDNNRKLWFGTDHGLYSYHNKTASFTKMGFKNRQIDSLHITCLFQDKNNTLWIGTHHDHSIFKLEDDSITLAYKSEYSNDDFNWISSIATYNDEKLIVAIKDLGVQTIDLHTGHKSLLQPDKYKPNGINSKNPNIIYPDKAGNIWVGTYNNGINFLNKHKKKFNLYRFDFTDSGLLSNNVRAFYEDSDGDLWVGTKEGGGISKFDQANGTFINYKADPSNPNWLDNDIVICIHELEKGKLLVGTYGDGIYLFDKKNVTFSKFAMPDGRNNSISDKYVYALYKDGEDRIWIGSNSSVDIYHTATGKFSHLRDVNFARCFIDNGNKILIGTWTKGLYIYDKTENRIEDYVFNLPDLQKNKNIKINGMARDRAGYVWMATNKGLLRFKQAGETELLLTEKDGLPKNYICAVLVDDNDNIWASTKIGIVKYNQKSGEFKTYNKYDGLQSNVFEEFVSLKTEKGYMLFSGLNGFNMFHPDSIIDNTIAPMVHLSDMRILNQSVPIGTKNSPLKKHIDLTDHIILKNEQSSFGFELVAVNYTSPEKARYLYMLDGYDKEWQEAGNNRIANYTKIPAGYYTLKVKASNGDGVWSKEKEFINVRVKPPFSRSLPAFILYFLILVAFLAVYRRFVKNSTMQKNRLAEEIEENKRLEELSKKRIRFFTNISHELRTPLTLIASPLERLATYNFGDKQLSSMFDIMNRNAQRLTRIVNQLMDFRRIEENRIRLHVAEVDIIKYVEDVLANFNDIANNRSLKLNFHTNRPEGYKGWFDEGILDKILFNLLSNAVKFSPVNGEIDLEVIIENNEASIKVTDRGIGIPAKDLDKIFDRFYTTDQADHKYTGAGVGLSFTKSLIELHKGRKQVASEVGKGSCFTITFPIGREAYIDSELQVVPDKPLSETILKTTAEIAREEIKAKNAEHSDLILIVEDYDDLREYLVHNLYNYRVLSCANGKEALKLANENMPDLILSDIMMPEMDGLELCKHIKTNIITSHIPVVLLTARATPDQKLEGYTHHADAYVEKPFSIDLLTIQIANLLQLRKNISAKYNSDIKASVADDDGMLPLDKKFLDKSKEFIEASINDPQLSVESLSSELGMSRSQLFRKFKALTNTTPSQFIKAIRLRKAAQFLAGKEYNVNEVAIMVGFVDSSHFISSFKKFYGKTPKQFAESNATISEKKF